jgi:iron complex outermembrane receptor protein
LAKVVLGTCPLLAALPSLAQAQTQTQAQGQPEQKGLEEVVVTAQRREERLQDVPVAVTALSAVAIERRNLSEVTDLNGLAPNLQVTTAAASHSNAQVGIRGSLEINGAITQDPTVGMYVDGVFVGKSTGQVFDMLDLERVEVLRGPQGTLYGRNTLAGAINFVTREPSGEFGGMASVNVGNYDYSLLRASVDFPKVGILRASISGRAEKRDGWVDVVPDPYGIFTGPPPIPYVDDRDSQSWRASLAFDFSDSFTAIYRFDRTDGDQNHVYNQITSINSAFYDAFGIPFSLYVHPDRQDSFSTNLKTSDEVKVEGHSLTLTYDVSDALQFKSITGYRTMDRDDVNDLDGSPLSLAEATLDIRYHAFSQELQAFGDTQRWNYVFGLYYSDDSGTTINGLDFFGLFGPFGTLSDSVYGGGAETYAAYGQVDFKWTDQLTLTAGLRYTHEKKDFFRYLHQLAAPGAEITASGWRDNGFVPIETVLPEGVTPCTKVGRDAVCSDKSFSDTTPTFTVSYKFNDDLMAYGRYAEGYKSGGYNGETNFISEVQTPYKPVKQKTYELGLKSQFWDGRAQVNVAAFQNDSEDLQLSVFLGSGSVASVVRNAASATVRGFEIEALFQPLPDWLLRLSYGYLAPEFDEFIDNVGPGGTPVNVADNRAFPHAPKNSLNVSLDALLFRTGIGALHALAEYNYVDENYFYPYAFVPENPAVQQTASNTLVDSRGIVNAKLMLSDIPLASGQLEVSIWGRNLTDEEYEENVIDFGPTFGSLKLSNFGQPRTYGAEVSWRW